MAVNPTILPVYRRADVTMQRGEGVYLFDTSGKKYLDFASGIAVNLLGHSHPHLVAEMQKQVSMLWHCSNFFNNEQLDKYVRRMAELSGLHSVFCCNSGAEAAEAAIKFTRRYHDKTGTPERYRIIVAEGAYHGRTMATLSACQNPKVIDGYAPLMDCFDFAPFNNADALEPMIGAETAAIMLEPIQGEGGIRPHNVAYLQKARELCDKYNLLLIFDEVQTGMGRCGEIFGYEAIQRSKATREAAGEAQRGRVSPPSNTKLKPDMLLLGKGVGGGFPLAVTIVHEKIAAVMEAGNHGSTYGNNPLAMCAGNAVLDVMLEEGFMPNMQARAAYLHKRLAELLQKYPHIFSELRGAGMLLGLVTKVSAYELQVALREAGLLVVPAGGEVLRVIPPLIIEDSHVDEAMGILENVLENRVFLA
jgi:acetylornithine/N-succinyldiaminopimelate aminotransferase